MDQAVYRPFPFLRENRLRFVSRPGVYDQRQLRSLAGDVGAEALPRLARYEVV